MRGEVDNLRREDLLVIKAMLEHGELVSICLGGLYDELLRLEQEGPPPDQPTEAHRPSS
jgi:hypothetical protein